MIITLLARMVINSMNSVYKLRSLVGVETLQIAIVVNSSIFLLQGKQETPLKFPVRKSFLTYCYYVYAECWAIGSNKFNRLLFQWQKTEKL